MGFRFSKRIALLPGVRVNVSKSGASLSVGPRGASVTMGKRGVYGNVGLPGSGLSYRERLDKPDRPERVPPAVRPQLPSRLVAILDNDEIRFTDENDRPLDPLLYPRARRAMKDEIAGLLERNATARNAAIDELLALHHDVPLDVQPTRPGSAKPRRETYPDQEAFMEALMLWRAAEANAGPDPAAIENDLLAALGKLAWPRETNIAIDLRSDRLLLDVDLPEIEDMPTARWAPNNGFGSLVAKNITPQGVAALYLGHISSLILRLIGHSFSVSSEIRSVAVSAYTQRSGSTGRVDDEYVAVAEIDRNGWNQVDRSQMSSIDPENLLRRFGARMEANSRGILKILQPFE
jgi:hypothetical protein